MKIHIKLVTVILAPLNCQPVQSSHISTLVSFHSCALSARPPVTGPPVLTLWNHIHQGIRAAFLAVENFPVVLQGPSQELPAPGHFPDEGSGWGSHSSLEELHCCICHTQGDHRHAVFLMHPPQYSSKGLAENPQQEPNSPCGWCMCPG